MNNMESSVIKLLQSFDAYFPIGSFTLSNGMETYTENGTVRDEETLTEHLTGYLYTAGYNELAFCRMAYEGADISELDALFGALKSPKELRTGSQKQFARFLKIQSELCRCPALAEYGRMTESGECDGYYPIAVGLYMRDIAAPLETGLAMYAYSIISNFTNHAAKLVPLRQADAQRALGRAASAVPMAVRRAMAAKYGELGASGAGFDLSSMKHETMYSRLYIS